MHEGLKLRQAEMCDVLTAGCAERRTSAPKLDGVAVGFVKTLVEYTSNLDDKFFEEHDPLASKLRKDESAQLLSAFVSGLFASRRGAVATPQPRY